MKKILCFILCLLLMPIMVYANEAIYVDYEVKVSDENGVKLYDYDGELVTTIPYDTLLYITYEYSENNVLYGYTTYDEEYGYIDLSNTMLHTTSADLSSYEEEDSITLYVYKEDCIMFSGPSLIYDKLNIEIPIGTTLETNYYYDGWAYVEYNGVSGWIYVFYYEESSNIYDTLDVSVAYVNTNNDEIIVIKENDLNIPILTTISYEYSINDNHYLTYNGVSGWLKSSATNFYNISYITYDNVTLYERKDYFSYNTTSIELPANYEGDALCWYEDDDTYEYYVCKTTYNGQTYYILNKYEYSDDFIYSLSAYTEKYSIAHTVIIGEDTIMYDSINGEILETIPEYTKLILTYDGVYFNDTYYYYVTYNGISGWIEHNYVYEDSDNLSQVDPYFEFDDGSISYTYNSVFPTYFIILFIILILCLVTISIILYLNKRGEIKKHPKLAKIILSILTILSIITLYFIVMYIKGFDVIVNLPMALNEEIGTYLYDSKLNVSEVIPYDTELKINYVKKMDGYLYGYTSYDGINGYVLLNYVILKSDEELGDYEILEEDESYSLHVYKDTYMYSGPSNRYDKISSMVIPEGTILTPIATDGSYLWYYVTYNDVSGWIYVGDGETQVYDDIAPSIAYYYQLKFINTEDITYLFAEPDAYFSKLISVYIPKYSHMECDYCTLNFCHISYEDVEGWLYFDGYSIGLLDEDTEFITYKETTLYTINDSEFIASNTILANYKGISNDIVVEDDYYIYYKIDYNNKEYYIKGIDLAFKDEYSSVVLEDTIVYDVPGGSSIATISSGENIEILYSKYIDDINYYYVICNDISGWVNPTYDFVSGYTDTPFITYGEVTLYKIENGSLVNSNMVLPVNYEGTVSAVVRDDIFNYIYQIEYNSEKYYIKTYLEDSYTWTPFTVGKLNDSGIMTVKKTKLYDSITKDNVVTVIPSGERIKVISNSAYSYEDGELYDYIEYNGYKGWVLDEDIEYIDEILINNVYNYTTLSLVRNVIVILLVIVIDIGVCVYISKKKKS